VRGEPIVCTPAEAYRCFLHTNIDALALGNYLLLKQRQAGEQEASEYLAQFHLD
jgi:carbamoyltransferase